MKVMKWIKCSERMPELNQEVLCADECGIQDVARYAIGYLGEGVPLLYTACGTAEATHWMPLPEPPGAEVDAGGRSMPPHEFAQMVNALRDVPSVQCKREKIVSVLRAFNIKARHQ